MTCIVFTYDTGSLACTVCPSVGQVMPESGGHASSGHRLQVEGGLLWRTRVRVGVQSPVRADTRDSHTGGGSVVSPPSLPLLGAFSCVGDLSTNEGQARHVGLTAGEGVALSNVVQRQPAPGAAGLRPPPSPPPLPLPARPHLEPLGLAPPCSLGRSENL